MRSEKEVEYLLKAVDAFQKRLIVVSPKFKILVAHCNFNSINDSDLPGKLCYQIFYGRDTPCENCAVQQVIEHGRPSLRPQPMEGSDLEKMSCFSAYPILSGQKVEAIVSMDFDLPTRGEIEQQLQNTNILLRKLILNAVDGVIAVDKTGKVLIFNNTATELFGYTIEEALNSVNIREIYPEGVAYEVMRKLRSEEYGGRGKLRSYQVDVLDKQGNRIPIDLNAAIVYDNDQEVASIGFFHDMREILEMKAELEDTRVQLLQAEKMASLGKLAAGVAHQLNNPLSGITLFTKLVLEDYDLESGARKDLSRVLRDVKRCRDTVKELLEFARQTRHLMQPHDINRAISRTLFLLENQSLFQNIRIEKELDPELPAVKSDIQQINHLFMNIILNAAQAMDGKGRLTLRTGLLPGGDRVRIEIADTGPGIPEDILPKIFDPFFTTKEEGEGTGLGLSLVYGIVKDHGGLIRAESQAGKGTTFIIELPLNPTVKGE
ncbi:MAG: PAS domain-containing sensor histidine kinase [Deltaproteobacteria bacterium]|nr:MAG: PAS domain-containing sensor histidine kinase [Deltaproteobacteria bacterium]